MPEAQLFTSSLLGMRVISSSQIKESSRLEKTLDNSVETLGHMKVITSQVTFNYNCSSKVIQFLL